jgi:hypothetical protein
MASQWLMPTKAISEGFGIYQRQAQFCYFVYLAVRGSTGSHMMRRPIGLSEMLTVKPLLSPGCSYVVTYGWRP